METRIQILAVIGSGVLLLGVLELVRRRALLERYALVWLGTAGILLVLAVWGGLLSRLADLTGIIYPPNALFVVAFVFVILLLLNFSAAVSRLTDQTKVLAQRIALLEERLRETEASAVVAVDREDEGREVVREGSRH